MTRINHPSSINHHAGFLLFLKSTPFVSPSQGISISLSFCYLLRSFTTEKIPSPFVEHQRPQFDMLVFSINTDSRSINDDLQQRPTTITTHAISSRALRATSAAANSAFFLPALGRPEYSTLCTSTTDW